MWLGSNDFRKGGTKALLFSNQRMPWRAISFPALEVFLVGKDHSLTERPLRIACEVNLVFKNWELFTESKHLCRCVHRTCGGFHGCSLAISMIRLPLSSTVTRSSTSTRVVASTSSIIMGPMPVQLGGSASRWWTGTVSSPEERFRSLRRP